MRLRSVLTAGLSGFVLLAFGCVSQRAPSADTAGGTGRATVIFTADLWGQLEPCGCSADMRGGLDRAAAWVKSRRAEGPTLLVDAGDAYFDLLAYGPRDEPQAMRKALAVHQSLLEMGLDAKAFFERDRVLPVEELPAEKRLVGPRVLEKGGLRVGLVPLDATAGDVAAQLEQGVAALRGQGAHVVGAILHAPRARVISLSGAAAAAGADFVVGSHIDTIAEGEEARAIQAELPLFFTQARGQSLLEVELVRRGDGSWQVAGNPAEQEREIEALGERIRAFSERLQRLPADGDRAPFEAKLAELQARRRQLAEEPVQPPATGNYLAWRFVPVTQDRPADPKVQALLASYDRDVAAANLAFAKANPQPCPTPAEGEASFVGGATCAGCHPAAAGFWQETGHAHAYATLEKIDKQYDLNCVSCHVTGWERPGGACDVANVDARKDVTCESCHGPGSQHVAAPTQVKLPARVPESTCLGCHTPENSLGFDYGSYLQRIVGPGHGAPAK